MEITDALKKNAHNQNEQTIKFVLTFTFVWLKQLSPVCLLRCLFSLGDTVAVQPPSTPLVPQLQAIVILVILKPIGVGKVCA